MFVPTVELIEERIVPCCTPVKQPPVHCQPTQCQPVCHPIQHTVVDGNAQATNISYIVNGKTPVTSLNSSNLHSGDTVEVVFTVPQGSKPTTFSFVSYTATGDFNLPDQKIYDVAEVTTCGGGTYSLKIHVPCDYFQVDFVRGGPITHFTGETYHGDNRYLGGTTGGMPGDCKCMDDYFCHHHQDCCNVTNITNNTYNTYNNTEINNVYNSMLTSLVKNYSSFNYSAPQQQVNNQFNFGSNETHTSMANTGYNSSHENPPNIHDMVGPTVMGGTDDVKPSDDVIQKFLHPNGDKPVLSPFDGQPSLVVPCQPVPQQQNCPPIPCQR